MILSRGVNGQDTDMQRLNLGGGMPSLAHTMIKWFYAMNQDSPLAIRYLLSLCKQHIESI